MASTRDEDKPVDRLVFRSPINSEGSWGQRNLSRDTESSMELYLYKNGQGSIEWIVEELDLVEHIGCTFEFDAKGKRTLVDYDGVFSLPDQAMDLLERNGIDFAEMRETLKD